MRLVFASKLLSVEQLFCETYSCWAVLFHESFRTGGGVAAGEVWEGGGAVLDGAAVPAAIAPQGKCERGSCSKLDTASTHVSSV